jgi:hypothetical protein
LHVRIVLDDLEDGVEADLLEQRLAAALVHLLQVLHGLGDLTGHGGLLGEVEARVRVGRVLVAGPLEGRGGALGLAGAEQGDATQVARLGQLTRTVAPPASASASAFLARASLVFFDFTSVSSLILAAAAATGSIAGGGVSPAVAAAPASAPAAALASVGVAGSPPGSSVLGSPAVPGAELLPIDPARVDERGVDSGVFTTVAGVAGATTGASFFATSGAGVWQATTVQTVAVARTSRRRVRMPTIISEHVAPRIVVTLTPAPR